MLRNRVTVTSDRPERPIVCPRALVSMLEHRLSSTISSFLQVFFFFLAHSNAVLFILIFFNTLTRRTGQNLLPSHPSDLTRHFSLFVQSSKFSSLPLLFATTITNVTQHRHRKWLSVLRTRFSDFKQSDLEVGGCACTCHLHLHRFGCLNSCFQFLGDMRSRPGHRQRLYARRCQKQGRLRRP